MNNEQLKIAVIHDHMEWPGGGERTALIMALDLGADFITAYANPKAYPEHQAELGDRLKVLSRTIETKRVFRYFWTRKVFRRNHHLLDGYDILIASGQAASEVVTNYGSSKARRLLYCHTPPRRVYDLFESSRQMYPFYLRFAYSFFTKRWDKLYRRALSRFDYIISNNHNITERLAKYTGFWANEEIPPPIITANYANLGQGDYFLSWGRVDEQKRIELIIEAFARMPEQKLIVASGGPRLEAVKQLARGHKNITIVGWVSDDELKKLVGNCQAAIYIPVDEDAGMTQLEANAAGKPVIGVDEGGLRDTIIEGVTGTKIKANPTADDIIIAVQQFTPEWCQSQSEKCLAHAKKYDREIFSQKIKSAVSNLSPERKVLAIDASRWEDPRQPGKGERSGVEVYSREIITALVQAVSGKPDLRLELITPRLIIELPRQVQKVLPGGKRWTITVLDKYLAYRRPNYFLTPSYYLPRHSPENSIAVVHDIKFKTDPERYSLTDRLWQGVTTRYNLHRAKRIIAVSQATKDDLVMHYGCQPNDVVVVPMGYTRWIIGNDKNTRTNTILYVGRIDKKKSISILIAAFAQIYKKYPNWRLVLAGKPGFGSEEILAMPSKLGVEAAVIFLGYISDAQKKQYLLDAAIFVQPSATEGAAIPLLEAWDAATPGIVADTPVMREIGSKGVVYFKPEDAYSLAQKIEELINNIKLGEEIVVTGQKKLASMSWPEICQQILKIFLEK